MPCRANLFAPTRVRSRPGLALATILSRRTRGRNSSSSFTPSSKFNQSCRFQIIKESHLTFYTRGLVIVGIKGCGNARPDQLIFLNTKLWITTLEIVMHVRRVRQSANPFRNDPIKGLPCSASGSRAISVDLSRNQSRATPTC